MRCVVIISTSLILLYNVSYSQTGFKPCILTNHEGIQKSGFIYLRSGNVGALSIEFEEKEGNSYHQVLTPHDIAELRVNGRIYHSKYLFVDSTDVRTFVELLSTGKQNLYEAYQGFYFGKPNDPKITLLSESDKSKDYYKIILKELLKDYPLLNRAISNTSYKRKDLKYLFDLFNNYEQLNNEKIYRPIIRIESGVGLTLTQAKFEGNESVDYFTSMKYNFENTPSFYITTLFASPRNPSLILGLEFSANKKIMTGYSKEMQNGLQVEQYLDIDYKVFTTGIKFNYEPLVRNKNPRPYLSFSIGKAFLSSKNTQLIVVESTLTAGIKTIIKNKYSIKIETRFDYFGNQISTQNQSLTSQLYCFTPVISLGYEIH